MSEQQSGVPSDAQPIVPPAEEGEKLIVFAVRIDPARRAQIEGLRGITGQSVNEVGVEAIDGWIANKLEDPEVRQKALKDLDAEEQRLKDRRATIAGVLGSPATTAVTEASPKNEGETRSTRRGKTQPGS